VAGFRHTLVRVTASRDAEHRPIRQALLDGPPLRLAILFGSRARGTARPDSDVDIAVLPVDPALSLHDEGRLTATLERAAGAPVDLVRLDHAPLALRWRIARDGIVLLSNPPETAPRFLARTGIEHDERRDLTVDAMRRYQARLAGAAPNSAR
jgi:predicted nucleotidyltransferase